MESSCTRFTAAEGGARLAACAGTKNILVTEHAGFISTSVLIEHAHKIRGPLSAGCQRSVYITRASRIECVSHELSILTDLSVAGASAFDDVDDWTEELEAKEILVCTSNVLKPILEKQILMISDVNVMIIDSCHLIFNDQNLQYVMKLYKQCKKEKPRILAITYPLFTAPRDANETDSNETVDIDNEINVLDNNDEENQDERRKDKEIDMTNKDNIHVETVDEKDFIDISKKSHFKEISSQDECYSVKDKLSANKNDITDSVSSQEEFKNDKDEPSGNKNDYSENVVFEDGDHSVKDKLIGNKTDYAGRVVCQDGCENDKDKLSGINDYTESVVSQEECKNKIDELSGNKRDYSESVVCQDECDNDIDKLSSNKNNCTKSVHSQECKNEKDELSGIKNDYSVSIVSKEECKNERDKISVCQDECDKDKLSGNKNNCTKSVHSQECKNEKDELSRNNDYTESVVSLDKSNKDKDELSVNKDIPNEHCEENTQIKIDKDGDCEKLNDGKIDINDAIESREANMYCDNLDDFKLYEKLEWKIEDLEKELCCDMDLAEDIDGVKRLSATLTKPKEFIIEYNPRVNTEVLPEPYMLLEDYMRTTVSGALDFINEHRYDPTEIYGDDMYEEFSNIPDPTDDPKQLFKQFIYVLDELGPYAADKAAFTLLVKLEKLKIKVPYERHFLLLCLCTSVFVKIRCYADLLFSKCTSEWEKIVTFSTPKVLRLAEILENFQPPENLNDTATVKDADKTESNIDKMNDKTDSKVQIVKDDNRNVKDNVNRIKRSKTNELLKAIEKCDFTTLGNKIEDRVNTYAANLKDLDDIYYNESSPDIANSEINNKKSLTNVNEIKCDEIFDAAIKNKTIIDNKNNQKYSVDKAIIDKSNITANNGNQKNSVCKRQTRDNGLNKDSEFMLGVNVDIANKDSGNENGNNVIKIKDSGNKEGGNKEGGNKDGGNKDIGNKDNGNEATGNKDIDIKDSGNKDGVNKNENNDFEKKYGGNKGSKNKNGENKDTGNKDNGNKDGRNNDSRNMDSGNKIQENNDSQNKDAGNKDSGNKDGGNKDTGNNDGGNKEGNNIDGAKDNDNRKLGYGKRAGNKLKGRFRLQRNNTKLQQLQQNPDSLCGIVFVKEALMAKIMFMMIVDMSRSRRSLSYLNVQYCATEGGGERDCQREGKKQEEVLKKFRMHECNLLLATSVLEEGIDLPRCNLIVRWDVPPSYRSHGLCRSRARAPRALVALLASAESHTEALVHNLAVYKELDQIITRKCGCGIQFEPPLEEENHADSVASIVKPYTPVDVIQNDNHSEIKCEDTRVKDSKPNKRYNEKKDEKIKKEELDHREAINIDLYNREGVTVVNEIRDICEPETKIDTKIDNDVENSENINEITDNNEFLINKEVQENVMEIVAQITNTVTDVNVNRLNAEGNILNATEPKEFTKDFNVYNKTVKSEIKHNNDFNIIEDKYCDNMTDEDKLNKEIKERSVEKIESLTKAKDHNKDAIEDFDSVKEIESCKKAKDLNKDAVEDFESVKKIESCKKAKDLNKDAVEDFESVKEIESLTKAKDLKKDAVKDFESVKEIESLTKAKDLDKDAVNFESVKKIESLTKAKDLNKDAVKDFDSVKEIESLTKANLKKHAKECFDKKDNKDVLSVFDDKPNDNIEAVRDGNDKSVDFSSFTGKDGKSVYTDIKYDFKLSDCKKADESIASVDLNSAIALINRYCGKLPSDTFTRLAPQWWMEEVRLPDRHGMMKRAYICTLRMPLNCPVKYNIVGHPMPTRVLARRMVALQACRILHKSGELDNQLMPIGKENFKAAELESTVTCSEPDSGDCARPGTTKRRQYYFKRTAWAFTDCQAVVDSTDEEIENNPTQDTAKASSHNMLYAIVSRLWCALPERYNTRGRRLHAPQHATQAIGVLMARREPTQLQIPAFPVYTRSGEVRVSVEPALEADVRISPRRAKLIRRFMRFVFTDVLRVRRRGMRLQTEGTVYNNYYVVPTIKKARSDGTSWTDVDWSFLELIYKHTEEQKNLEIEKPIIWVQEEKKKEKEKDGKVKMDNPLLKDGEVFTFDPEKYKEAVVTPWYRNQDQPQFFLVAEICWKLSPDSAFPSAQHDSFRSYYRAKYGAELTQSSQPLLDVDHTSARLNLLTPRYVNRKGVTLPVSSERTRRAKRDRLDQKQILVPELCRVHPFAAPLWFATVALPCVLYRINALLIADEIRRAVAIDVGLGIPRIDDGSCPGFQWPPLDFGWSLAEVLNADSEKTEKIKDQDNESKGDAIDEASDNVVKENAETLEEKEKTINDILQEKLEAESGFEIGTWSNDMASSIPQIEYDEFMEPLPSNLTFCTSSSGGANWSQPIEKPKGQFNPTRSYYVADSDCSYISSDFDTDDSDLSDGSDEDTDTSGFCNSRNTNAAMGVRIEYKTAHEAEAVDLERRKPIAPAPQPDKLDDDKDLAEYKRILRAGVPPRKYIEKFKRSVAQHKKEIKENGNLICKDKPIVNLLPEATIDIEKYHDHLGNRNEINNSDANNTKISNVDKNKNDEEKTDASVNLLHRISDEIKENIFDIKHAKNDRIIYDNTKIIIGNEGKESYAKDMSSNNDVITRTAHNEAIKSLSPSKDNINSSEVDTIDNNLYGNIKTPNIDVNAISNNTDSSKNIDDKGNENECNTEVMKNLDIRKDSSKSPESIKDNINYKTINITSQNEFPNDLIKNTDLTKTPNDANLKNKVNNKEMQNVLSTVDSENLHGVFNGESIANHMKNNEKQNKLTNPIKISKDAKKVIEEIFPFESSIELKDGQITLESIERSKRQLLAELKKSLSDDEIKKLNCFSMIDVDIDSPDYVNEKVANVGFDSKEKYQERVTTWFDSTENRPYYMDSKGQNGKDFDFDYQPDLQGHPGPSPSVILQALTMSNANDGINLERLETIGDSFLKFAITAYLYCAHPAVHEGKLSHMRSKQVSNLNLYRLGRSKRLGARMIASKFEPHDNWLPPCHRPPPTLQPGVAGEVKEPLQNSDAPVDSSGCFIPYNLITQHSIPDKSIADCVEALIGAYLLECGPRGALLFMSWLGIRVLPRHVLPLPPDHPYVQASTHKQEERVVQRPPPPKPLEPESSDSSCSDDEEEVDPETGAPEPDWGWLGRPVGTLRPYQDRNGKWMQPIFGELKAPPSPLLRHIEDPEGELERMLSGYDALERTLQYRFRDRSLLLQALTHASHQKNRLTDCYQRLEFLGDAILDYLITRHLYEDPRRHSPGALTDLRSALVNNTIFATLAARHGFHKYFRHMSPGLNEVLTKYVKIQEENGHSISEEHYLIQEDEMEQAEDVEVPKALGDLFESVAGAIFLDSGMSLGAVWRSVGALLGAELDAFSAAAPKSPVRELLEAEPDTAKFGKPERLADGRRVRVCVEVFGRGAFKGIGRNYRIAKGTAARCALRHLRIHKPR